MKVITLIDISWTGWHGFDITILNIEAWGFDGELFGVHISEKRVAISIAFFWIEVYHPLNR
jgi:hypothetical protein